MSAVVLVDTSVFLNILSWLDDFPDNAMRGLSFADLSIIKEWEKACALNPMRRVRIWTLDEHLGGYDRKPKGLKV